MSALCHKRTSWVAHAACDLACLLAQHKCAQSPSHGETGSVPTFVFQSPTEKRGSRELGGTRSVACDQRDDQPGIPTAKGYGRYVVGGQARDRRNWHLEGIAMLAGLLALATAS